MFGNKECGGPNTRYKSWEYCHAAFLEFHDKNDNKCLDYLALHLGFYLASWGMYRGSSFLLQRDYRAHLPAVKALMNNRYKDLWDFDPSNQDIGKAKELLFANKPEDMKDINEESGLYWRIKYSYANYDGCADTASDTLTTKILMGTLGCIPAFDRF